MRAHTLILLGAICSAMAGSVVLAEEVEPASIDDLMLQQAEVPQGFVLFQESIGKPGVASGETIYQHWRRRTNEEDLELIEERLDTSEGPVEGWGHQIWYRGEAKGERDKLEVEIVVCPSQARMEWMIAYNTGDRFATPFEISSSPVAGERSWAPKSKDRTESFSVMFQRGNVFIRLFVRLYGLSEEQVLQGTRELAIKIDNKPPLLTAVDVATWGNVKAQASAP